MIDINVTKLPVIIIAAPRTGSTVLGGYFQKLHNNTITYFDEPDYGTFLDMVNFENHFYNNKNFIFKFHLYTSNLYKADIIKYISYSDQCFRIRLRRRNLANQVASMYIAKARKNAFLFHSKTELNDMLIINEEHIKQLIRFIKHSNQILQDTDIEFDLDLFYEELGEIQNTNYYITPKPTNYNEIVSAVVHLL